MQMAVKGELTKTYHSKLTLKTNTEHTVWDTGASTHNCVDILLQRKILERQTAKVRLNQTVQQTVLQS